MTSAVSSGAPCTPPMRSLLGGYLARWWRGVAGGYDGRLTSPELEQALVQGLRASGIEVARIGLGPTPMLYYTATKLETDGAIMVTGSHNPPDYNGFKMMWGRKPFFGEQILQIGRLAASGDVVPEA